jgi:hypothetical protein
MNKLERVRISACGTALFALSSAPVAAQPLSLSYMPLRAPFLASACAAPDGAELKERLTSFCAGYVTAVLENDPRLADCHPLRMYVLDEIIARQRQAPITDNEVLARDFVVEVARDLCRRTRPS